MKGSAEDFIGYFVIMIVFIAGFLPLLSTHVVAAQAIADEKTAIVLGFLIPMVIIAIVVGFFYRLRGDGRTFGSEW